MKPRFCDGISDAVYDGVLAKLADFREGYPNVPDGELLTLMICLLLEYRQRKPKSPLADRIGK
jgi:hypothetical protein